MAKIDHSHYYLYLRSAIFYYDDCIVSVLISTLLFNFDNFESEFWTHPAQYSKFLALSLIGGAVAFLLNISEIGCLAKSSALSFTCVLSGFKLVLMLGLSYMIFGQSVTRQNCVGYLICGCSIIAYNFFKISQDLQQSKALKKKAAFADTAEKEHLIIKQSKAVIKPFASP